MPTTEEILAAVDTGEWFAHHGIEGQKWGKRNGPPYPLDYGDHSSEEKKHLSRSEKKNLKRDKKNLQRQVNMQKAYERASDKAFRKEEDVLADRLNEARKIAKYESEKMYDDMVKKYGSELVGNIPSQYKNVDSHNIRNALMLSAQVFGAPVGFYSLGTNERRSANRLYNIEKNNLKKTEKFDRSRNNDFNSLDLTKSDKKFFDKERGEHKSMIATELSKMNITNANLDNLSRYTTVSNDGQHALVSYWFENDDPTGGHSMDIEYHKDDSGNWKRSKYVSFNG